MMTAEMVHVVSNAFRIPLEDGYAENMGDGMFVLFQEVDGEPQSVALSRADLARLIGAI